MMSTEENCIYEDINDEEIENAIQPAFMFVSKLLNKIKKGISQKNEKRKAFPSRHHSFTMDQQLDPKESRSNSPEFNF